MLLLLNLKRPKHQQRSIREAQVATRQDKDALQAPTKPIAGLVVKPEAGTEEQTTSIAEAKPVVTDVSKRFLNIAKENAIASHPLTTSKETQATKQQEPEQQQKIQPKSLSSEQKAGLQQQVREIKPHESDSLVEWKNMHTSPSKSGTSKVETGFLKREIKPDSSFEYMP